MSTTTNSDFCADPDTYDHGDESCTNQSLAGGSIITEGPSMSRSVPKKQMTSQTFEDYTVMDFERGEARAQSGMDECSRAQAEIEKEHGLGPAREEQVELAQETQPASSRATSAVSGRSANPTLALSTDQSGRITKPSVERSFAGSRGSSQKRPQTDQNRFFKHLTEDLRGDRSGRQQAPDIGCG